MRESTGGAYLMYIAIFFIGTVMIMFVSALSYNKAFKIKNHIIEIIEACGEFKKDSEAEAKIISYLKDRGYSIKSSYKGKGCPSLNGKVSVEKANNDSFEYCVYEYDNSGKVYYKVVTYAYFDFPIIDNLFRYKIYGETKLMDKE